MISCDSSLDYGGGIEIMKYIIEKQKFLKFFNIHSTHIEISKGNGKSRKKIF